MSHPDAPQNATSQDHETTPLLRQHQLERNESRYSQHVEFVRFEQSDTDDPRQWTYRRKMLNVFVIALMAIVSPLASSMFTPAIGSIAEDLDTPTTSVVAAATGYVITLGIGPVILAPLSETFGRRPVYFWCYGLFCLLQIPTALSPNVETLVVLRVFCGFLGSCGIACGGGTISDMFDASQRASVFGWYLLGPIVGPTIGPLLGGLIAQFLQWRWIFWIMAVMSLSNMAVAIFCLQETYAPVILEKRCRSFAKERGGQFTFEGRDERPLSSKLARALIRPLKILVTQPIVIILALYQATLFATMYTLYTSFESIFKMPPYQFTTAQVGLMFLPQGLGSLFAVWFIVPRIDTIYRDLTAQHDGVGKPEFRLPLANVGSVLLPVSLVWFAWTVEFRVHWAACISSTVLYGVGSVCILNTVQNYYLDAFTTFSASTIAAGAFVRSLTGGLVPIASPLIFEQLGYGWGWSLFALMTLLLAPSPALFMRYGERIRTRFALSDKDL